MAVLVQAALRCAVFLCIHMYKLIICKYSKKVLISSGKCNMMAQGGSLSS